MKHLFAALVILIAFTACNNGAADGHSVGDSLEVDPSTAQPITTEPDTIGPEKGDSIKLNRNQ